MGTVSPAGEVGTGIQKFTRRQRMIIVLIAGLAAVAAFLLSIQESVADLRNLARWWLMMTALAFGLLACFSLRGAVLSGLLTMVLFIGGAAQLYVTEPLWYPELYLPPRSTFELGMFGLVLGQAVISIAVLMKKISKDTLRQFFGAFGLARIMVFFLLSSAFTFPVLNFLRIDDTGGYLVQIAAGAGLVFTNLATIIAIAVTLPGGTKLPAGWRWVWILAGSFLIATLLLAWFAFERMMHVQDELAYIFQARTYAGGALYVPALPEAARDAFSHYLMESTNDRWISVFTPGWPAVLSLGVLAGAPWLVNPILGTASIFLGYGVLRRLTDDRSAAVGMLLMAMSPWFIAMSASFMAHTLTLFLLVLAWALVLKAENSPPARAAVFVFVAGLAMGWMFLSRNLDGLLLGALTGFFLLWRGGVLRRPSILLCYSLGCVVTGGLIFLYNIYFTGDPFLTTLSDYLHREWAGGSNAYGFGQNIGPPQGWDFMELREHEHSPFEGFINTLTNISALHTDFLGWGVGSLALVWACFLWRPIDLTGRLMLIIVAVVVIAHAFYWFVASFYIGPRYWFMLFLPLVILSAKGFENVSARLKTAGFETAPGRLNAMLLILCLFSVAVFLSYRGLTRYHDHRGYSDHYRLIDLPETAGATQPLVLIKPERQLASAWFMNDPWFPPDKPVFAADLGPQSNAAVIEAFPGRPVLYYNEADGTFR